MNSRQRFLFLINPISGGGQGKRVSSHLAEIMSSFAFPEEEWSWQYTRRDDMAGQIRECLPLTDVLITVGGDGTLSAVLAEMVRLQHFSTRIGLIPLGTGNDLARSLGIYRSFVNRGLLYTIRKLIEADARLLDLWTLNGEPVLAAYVSAGLDARVAVQFNRDRSEGKLKSGSVLANRLHYLKCFWQNRSYRLPEGSQLRWEDADGLPGEKNLRGLVSVLVGNIDSYAGGADPFPTSNSSDGLLELVYLEGLASFAGCVSLCRSRFLACNLVHPFLQSRKIRSLELDLPEGVSIQVDGEARDELAGRTLKIEKVGQARLLHI